MDSQRHSPLDWQEFQRSLLKQMPIFGNITGEGIDDFVQSTIKKFMPKEAIPYGRHFAPYFTGSLDYELFESHRTIFVRCRIPKDVLLKDVRFFAGKRKLKVEYGTGRSEEIALPSDINTNRTVARFHEDILEIRMPKLHDSEPFREIFIRE